MHRKAVFLLVFLASANLVAADPLYKWVDAQGNVHYSDKPQPGAVKMDLPETQTFTAPTPTGGNLNSETHHQANTDAPKPVAPSYTKLEITSPAQDAVLWDVQEVSVSLSLDGPLQSGDSVSISLDGNTLTGSSLSAHFDKVGLGQHSVTATLNSKAGNSLSASSTFYTRQHTAAKHP